MDFDRRSNNFAAKPVRLLVQWVHCGSVLQKAAKKSLIFVEYRSPSFPSFTSVSLFYLRSFRGRLAIANPANLASDRSRRTKSAFHVRKAFAPLYNPKVSATTAAFLFRPSSIFRAKM